MSWIFPDVSPYAHQLSIGGAYVRLIVAFRKLYEAKYPEEENHDVLPISPVDFKNFFKTTIEKTMVLIQKLLQQEVQYETALTKRAAAQAQQGREAKQAKKLKDVCKTIFLVGGLASYKYYVAEITEQCKALGCRVIVPSAASSAILGGASIICGISRLGSDGEGPAHMFTERVMRATYGVATARLSQPGDPPHHTFTHSDGKRYTRNIFDTLVHINDLVCVQESFDKDYRTALAGDFTVSLYASSVGHPSFTDEPGCKLIKNILVPAALSAGPVRIRLFLARELLEARIENLDTKQFVQEVLRDC